MSGHKVEGLESVSVGGGAGGPGDARMMARIGDLHRCPRVSEGLPVPHLGGPIVGNHGGGVFIGGEPAAVATDACSCIGPRDYIVTGSSSVFINHCPVARVGDKTMHKGAIVEGCPSVWIGGGTVGVWLGRAVLARQLCQELSAGRAPHGGSTFKDNEVNAYFDERGRSMQSSGNCGIEACRQIVMQRGHPEARRIARSEGGEKAFASDYENNYNQGGSPGNVFTRAAHAAAPESVPSREWGASTPEGREKFLADKGVETEPQGRPQDMDVIQQGIADDKGVITSHDGGKLHYPDDPAKQEENAGGHAVLATGVKYDADGNPKTVAYNDSGVIEGCGKTMDADKFDRSLSPNKTALITKEPIYP